jgi:hypothetical protein
VFTEIEKCTAGEWRLEVCVCVASEAMVSQSHFFIGAKNVDLNGEETRGFQSLGRVWAWRGWREDG